MRTGSGTYPGEPTWTGQKHEEDKEFESRQVVHNEKRDIGDKESMDLPLNELLNTRLSVIYHGTTIKNGSSILESGCFDSKKKIDKGWGSTYGEGIYFTPNEDEARVYGKDGILLKITLELKPFYLTRDYSPTNKGHKTALNKLIKRLKRESDRNSLINIRGDEIIFFGDDINDKHKLIITQI